jgi:hypothetical protein
VTRLLLVACAVLACVLAPWAVLCLADLLLARWAVKKWQLPIPDLVPVKPKNGALTSDA